jgi:hypothetical protein
MESRQPCYRFVASIGAAIVGILLALPCSAQTNGQYTPIPVKVEVHVGELKISHLSHTTTRGTFQKDFKSNEIIPAVVSRQIWSDLLAVAPGDVITSNLAIEFPLPSDPQQAALLPRMGTVVSTVLARVYVEEYSTEEAPVRLDTILYRITQRTPTNSVRSDSANIIFNIPDGIRNVRLIYDFIITSVGEEHVANTDFAFESDNSGNVISAIVQSDHIWLCPDTKWTCGSKNRVATTTSANKTLIK